MDLIQFNEKMNALLSGLPPELSANVRAKVEFYKTKQPVFTLEEILDEAISLVRLEMLAFVDRRSYLGMYNRRWAEHKIGEHIRALVSAPSRDEKDLYTLLRVNFDLNGLKALNDLGGHEAGNKGLKIFSNILNFGATTLWLRDELGLNVTTTAEGGDEFGIVILGTKDLRPLTASIVTRYFEEVYSTDASYLLDFGEPKIKEKLALLGIAEEISKDFKFRLSTSVGVAVLGEAFDSVDVSKQGVSYADVVAWLTNSLMRLADERSNIHKSAFKKELAKSNPILSALYSRMSREVLHLEKRIKELEGKLKEK